MWEFSSGHGPRFIAGCLCGTAPDLSPPRCPAHLASSLCSPFVVEPLGLLPIWGGISGGVSCGIHAMVCVSA